MERLKALRCGKKLTQKQLSQKSGISQAYINELENGRKTNPSIVVLARLANALDVPVFELLRKEAYHNGGRLQAYCADK